MQLWVAQGDQPLPCRLVITYRAAEGQPQFWAQFSDWNLSPDVSDAQFVFTPPEGAAKIAFAARKPVPTTEEKQKGKKGSTSMRPTTRMQGLAWFALFMMLVFTVTDIEARGGGGGGGGRGGGGGGGRGGGAVAEGERGGGGEISRSGVASSGTFGSTRSGAGGLSSEWRR